MIDIFLDGANLDAMREGRKNSLVKGFTTNPSLARQAGVTDYQTFCKQALEIADGLPISFEVLSDEWNTMERQARKIASWGENVCVKIPVTNTKGENAAPLVKTLNDDGIVCNVTAILDPITIMHPIYQYKEFMKSPIIFSVFAGRIADTGINPIILIEAATRYAARMSSAKILWASPREVLNIHEAAQYGCHIITVTPDLLKKYEQLKGKDLTEYSLDTCKMFYDDAQKAGYKL